MHAAKNTTSKTQYFLEKEELYGAHNYHPLPVVLTKGKGVFVWDVEDRSYYDFLSAFSAITRGHWHPRCIEAFIEQAQRLTLTSLAFHNDQLGEYVEFITKFF